MLAVLGPLDLAVVVVFAIVVLYALRSSRKRLEVRIGRMHATIEDVNRAVNHKPPGAPTLYDNAAASAEGASAAYAAATAAVDTAREAAIVAKGLDDKVGSVSEQIAEIGVSQRLRDRGIAAVLAATDAAALRTSDGITRVEAKVDNLGVVVTGHLADHERASR